MITYHLFIDYGIYGSNIKNSMLDLCRDNFFSKYKQMQKKNPTNIL